MTLLLVTLCSTHMTFLLWFSRAMTQQQVPHLSSIKKMFVFQTRLKLSFPLSFCTWFYLRKVKKNTSKNQTRKTIHLILSFSFLIEYTLNLKILSSLLNLNQGRRNVYGRTEWSAQSFGKILLEMLLRIIDSKRPLHPTY